MREAVRQGRQGQGLCPCSLCFAVWPVACGSLCVLSPTQRDTLPGGRPCQYSSCPTPCLIISPSTYKAEARRNKAGQTGQADGDHLQQQDSPPVFTWASPILLSSISSLPVDASTRCCARVWRALGASSFKLCPSLQFKIVASHCFIGLSSICHLSSSFLFFIFILDNLFVCLTFLFTLTL